MLISTLLLPVMLIFQVLVPDLHGLPTAQKHKVCIPQQIHAEYKKDSQDKYPRLVKYELRIDEKPLVLHLKRNEDLIVDHYTETRYRKDGTRMTQRPKENVKDHCHYQGYVENDSQSKACISTCSGLSGVILTQGRRLLIEPQDLKKGEHIVYEKEETHKGCGVKNTLSEWSAYALEILPTTVITKDEIDQLMKSPKFIELLMVADHSFYLKYFSNDTLVRDRIHEIVNYADLEYKALNIDVVLKGVEVFDNSDLFEVDTDAKSVLESFCSWKKKELDPRIPHTSAQLLSNVLFGGKTVGLSKMWSMRCDRCSAGIVQDHSKEAVFVGATLIHELGKNLGLTQDDCSCPIGFCNMSPIISPTLFRQFSKSGLDQVLQFIDNGSPMCVLNKPNNNNILSPPFCGNKIVEKGEQCDCGTLQECSNPCCNIVTCLLRAGAECAHGECCGSCKIMKAGSECRPSYHECDVPDTCDGKSNLCHDFFKKDGTSCMHGQGYCFHGTCPTMQNQCNVLWGPGAVEATDACSYYNVNGNSFGYCARSGENYEQCQPKDVKCGLLFCFGGTYYPSVEGPVIRVDLCKATHHPSGMVENGTKCDNGKVCMKAQCTSIETAYESLASYAESPGQVTT